MDKYQALEGNYFGFDLFEEIFKVINERKHAESGEFNSGVASSESAVRRLREEYYTSIKRLYEPPFVSDDFQIGPDGAFEEEAK
jgi:hypothetical protein